MSGGPKGGAGRGGGGVLPGAAARRLARVRAQALAVWGDPVAARRFLAEPHALLGGEPPEVVAAASAAGARAVEQLLGRLRHGSAP